MLARYRVVYSSNPLKDSQRRNTITRFGAEFFGWWYTLHHHSGVAVAMDFVRGEVRVFCGSSIDPSDLPWESAESLVSLLDKEATRDN